MVRKTLSTNNLSCTLKSSAQTRKRAFSLIDVLVSISVIAVLISLLIPGLAAVNETANRVVCSSNIRQQGIGIALYADANRDTIPNTIFNNEFESDDLNAPQDSMTIRFASFSFSDLSGRRSDIPASWDGLGLLYSAEYLPTPGIFYCPSHRGLHPLSRYSEEWKSGTGEIVSNYQYRGKGPHGSTDLTMINPGRTALITDGLRTFEDYSHKVGTNVLRADLAVFWFNDLGTVSAALGSGDDGSTNMDSLWDQIDLGSIFHNDE